MSEECNEITYIFPADGKGCQRDLHILETKAKITYSQPASLDNGLTRVKFNDIPWTEVAALYEARTYRNSNHNIKLNALDHSTKSLWANAGLDNWALCTLLVYAKVLPELLHSAIKMNAPEAHWVPFDRSTKVGAHKWAERAVARTRLQDTTAKPVFCGTAEKIASTHT